MMYRQRYSAQSKSLGPMTSNTTRLLSSLEKSMLQASLHNVNFVNSADIDPYRCKKCGQVALYHYVALCEHVFCAKCHGKFYQKQCPIENCTNSSINRITQSLTFELEVYALQAYCKFRQNGCKDIIALADILMHQKKCTFSSKNQVPVPWVPPTTNEHTKQIEEKINKLRNDIKEFATELIDEKFATNNNLMRKEIERTNDKIYKTIEASFDQLRPCIAFDIAELMTRKMGSKTEVLKNETWKLMQHEFQCLSTKLEEVTKCATKMIQENADNEEKTLHLLEDKHKEEISYIKKRMEETAHQNNVAMDQLGTQVQELMERAIQDSNIAEHKSSKPSTLATQFNWRISNWKEVVLKLKDVSSDVFHTSDHGLKMRGKICFIKAINMSLQCSVFARCVLYVETVEDPSTEDTPTFVYYHRRTFVISCQDEDGTKRHLKIVQEPGFGSTDAADWMEEVFGVELFNSASGMELHALNVEEIQVDILIEPLSMLYQNCFSRNGVLLWNVENYSGTKQEMMYSTSYSNFDYLWSEYFYSVEGYRMRARLTFSEGLISVYLHVVHGEFDAMLAPPDHLQVDAMVLGLSGSEEDIGLNICHAKIPSKEGFKFYLGEIDCRKLETSIYLRNDSIVLKVMVEN